MLTSPYQERTNFSKNFRLASATGVLATTEALDSTPIFPRVLRHGQIMAIA